MAHDGAIILPAILDIAASDSLRQDLVNAQRPLAVDAGQVLEGSAAAAQVLLAGALALKAEGSSLAVVDPSDEFIAMFQELGLYGAFFFEVEMR